MLEIPFIGLLTTTITCVNSVDIALYVDNILYLAMFTCLNVNQSVKQLVWILKLLENQKAYHIKN